MQTARSRECSIVLVEGDDSVLKASYSMCIYTQLEHSISYFRLPPSLPFEAIET